MAERISTVLFTLGGFIFTVRIASWIAPLIRTWGSWTTVLLITAFSVVCFIIGAKLMRKYAANTYFGKTLVDYAPELSGFTIASFIAACVTAFFNDANFCIDNGTPNQATVVFEGKTSQIAPQGYLKLDMPQGTNKVTINGRDTTVELSKGTGYYIYNIDNANVYVEGSVFYGKSASEEEMQDTTGIKMRSGTYFYTDVKHLFKEPEFTFVSRRNRDKVVRETVIYRMSDLQKDAEE